MPRQSARTVKHRAASRAAGSRRHCHPEVLAPVDEHAPALMSGVRFEASPDAALAAAVPKWIGCQRFIYNGKVAEDRLFTSLHFLEARQYPDTAPWGPVDRQYSQLHDVATAPFLREVPSQVLRIGCERWFTAKQRHLKGLAKAP